MLTTCIFKQPLNTIDLDCRHEDFILQAMVQIDLLHPNQLNLDNEVINRKLKNPKFNTMPYVLYTQGQFILLDGHHTIASKMIKGIKKVKCLIHSI